MIARRIVGKPELTSVPVGEKIPKSCINAQEIALTAIRAIGVPIFDLRFKMLVMAIAE